MTKAGCEIKLQNSEIANRFLKTANSNYLTNQRFLMIKACVRYFFIIFFPPNDISTIFSFKNYNKYFLFHLKSSFRSRDIQIFVFSSSPLFFPVSHCRVGWSNKSREVYDGINCLNKNLITHFVYLEKEISCENETLITDRVLNKEHFYGKNMQKMCIKS